MIRTAKLTGAVTPGRRPPTYNYNAISAIDPEDEEATVRRESVLIAHLQRPRNLKGRRNWLVMLFSISGFLLLLYAALFSGTYSYDSCDTVNHGYQCDPDISHFWGHHSSYFIIPSIIPTEVPDDCRITFAQVLSRHGARNPTTSKTFIYNKTVLQIQQTVTDFPEKYAFLAKYEYKLGANQLTAFGRQQMMNSGIQYYNRYKELAKDYAPFVRSTGQDRVLQSAEDWIHGYNTARSLDIASNHSEIAPKVDVIISQDEGFNNTLSHGLCTSFEDGPESTISSSSQDIWASIFTPPITARLNTELPGANLSMAQTIYMMDLCPYDTVASPTGKISPFCDLFTIEEWHSYDYYKTLGMYYGYSAGNPLGPTQGVGFANELIARLTDSPVQDHTSTNRTLDSDPSTFPLGNNATKLYADFSHDSDLTSIFSALGLYSHTPMLSNVTMQWVGETHGYSSSWTVPFAGRAYFEKLSCEGEEEEFVRVAVNGRVLPLDSCGGDELGMCDLSSFVKSLEFVRNGGKWDQCFV